jgi:hypothetical protein
MFEALRDPSRGGVFNFVTGATIKNRVRGYECAGQRPATGS